MNTLCEMKLAAKTAWYAFRIPAQRIILVFFFFLFLLSGQESSDTKVCEPISNF